MKRFIIIIIVIIDITRRGRWSQPKPRGISAHLRILKSLLFNNWMRVLVDGPNFFSFFVNFKCLYV